MSPLFYKPLEKRRQRHGACAASGVRNLQPRLFKRAVEISGGTAGLAERLSVEEHALSLWIANRASPPDHVLDRLVDLILEDDIARAAQDRRREPRAGLDVVETRV